MSIPLNSELSEASDGAERSASEKPSILLTGSYSIKNKGDFAMQLIAAKKLQERGYVVAASVPFPDQDRDAYEALGVDVVPSSRRKLVRATWLLLRILLARLLPHERIRKILIPDKEASYFASASLIVDLSGDMLTEDYGPHVAYSHLLPLLIAHGLGTPVAAIAQSIGPFSWTRRLAVPALRKCRLVTVRDVISQKYVESLGLARPHLTADLAFLLEPDNAMSDDLWAELGIPSGPAIGVSVSGLIANQYGKRNDAADDDSFAQLMATTLDTVSREHGLAVVFFPHVTGPAPSKDDRRVSESIMESMSQRAWIAPGDIGPDTMKGMIAKCHTFVGARMHANIAALSSCVPTVAIAYSHKTPGIMQSLAMGPFVIHIEDLTRSGLQHTIEKVLTDHVTLTSRLQERLDQVTHDARQNIELLDDLIGGAA